MELEQSKLFKEVVQEYCITKLSSYLQCGPAMPPFLGFDLIVFSNRIEFGMEKCKPVSNFTQLEEEELFMNMALLHQLKIIHSDIKPDNIMFSPSQNKLILIDYGFADIVHEDQGFNTLTSFRGTP